jgi:iron complex transport system permease protein
MNAPTSMDRAPGLARRYTLTWALLAAAPLVILAALATGSVDLGWSGLGRVLSGGGQTLERTVVLELRLPRVLTAFAVGGLLSVAGTLLQALLRNPLADPYILGVSGGAAAAALGTVLLGLGGLWLPTGAVIGASVSIALVFGLSRTGGAWTQTRLLLTGVVFAAGWGALISFLLAMAPGASLQGMLFWLMGDLSQAYYPVAGTATLALGLALSLPLARPLNLLVHGELTAAALGERVERVRIAVYFLASLLTAAAVTLAGSIGFVGLIIPHLLRLVSGSDHRTLLPNAALLGGSFLVLADALARSLLAPRQLPVGVLTALIGVPVFLYLLQRSAKAGR